MGNYSNPISSKPLAVIYVTRTGTCRTLANQIRDLTDSEVFEIRDLSKRSGFFGFLRSGAQAMKGQSCPIEAPALDWDRYDTVVLIQPMWASSSCLPLVTWVRENSKSLASKRVAMVVSHLGTNPETIFQSFRDQHFPLVETVAIREKDPADTRVATLKSFIGRLASSRSQ